MTLHRQRTKKLLQQTLGEQTLSGGSRSRRPPPARPPGARPLPPRRHVLRHSPEPCPVTWRSCALCSRSRPGRRCPRCPPCRRSSSSSCGASCRHLRTPTRTGHGGGDTGGTQELNPMETTHRLPTSPRSRAAARDRPQSSLGGQRPAHCRRPENSSLPAGPSGTGTAALRMHACTPRLRRGASLGPRCPGQDGAHRSPYCSRRTPHPGTDRIGGAALREQGSHPQRAQAVLARRQGPFQRPPNVLGFQAHGSPPQGGP